MRCLKAVCTVYPAITVISLSTVLLSNRGSNIKKSFVIKTAELNTAAATSVQRALSLADSPYIDSCLSFNLSTTATSLQWLLSSYCP